MSWLTIDSCASMTARRLRQRVRTASDLSFGDWLTLIQAWVLSLAIDLGLRWLPFRKVRGFVENAARPADRRRETEPTEAIERTAWLVQIAGRHHLYPMGCLRRTLALQWLLSRSGICADLRIGVERSEAGLVAHAWLEYQGQPIGQLEGIEGHFLPLAAVEAGR